MKPKRIILIRHGESEANVTPHLFASNPDYAIELTDKGREQALGAGKRLKELVKDERLYFYVSPFTEYLEYILLFHNQSFALCQSSFYLLFVSLN